jgi:hypothetical protein
MNSKFLFENFANKINLNIEFAINVICKIEESL